MAEKKSGSEVPSANSTSPQQIKGGNDRSGKPTLGETRSGADIYDAGLTRTGGMDVSPTRQGGKSPLGDQHPKAKDSPERAYDGLEGEPIDKTK